MEVYLIRHTEVNTAVDLCYGQMEVPLAQTWKKEFNEVKRKLPKRLNQVYTSPSKRCLKLAKKLNGKVEIREELMDLNFGDWEGELWSEIPKDEFEAWSENHIKTAPPNGETIYAMFMRVSDFIDELRKQNDKAVAVVTHAWVIRCFMCYLLQIPLNNFFKLRIDYRRVYQIDLDINPSLDQLSL